MHLSVSIWLHNKPPLLSPKSLSPASVSFLPRYISEGPSTNTLSQVITGGIFSGGCRLVLGTLCPALFLLVLILGLVGR